MLQGAIAGQQSRPDPQCTPRGPGPRGRPPAALKKPTISMLSDPMVAVNTIVEDQWFGKFCQSSKPRMRRDCGVSPEQDRAVIDIETDEAVEKRPARRRRASRRRG